MSQASDLERGMLELINQERTSRGLDPLTLELRLNVSAEDHSSWMLNVDQFSHTGVNGSSAGDRMRDAEFTFSGSWSWGENIAWQTTGGAPGFTDEVASLHQALMNSDGHRANILSTSYDHIGIGVEIGDFNGRQAVMITQNFARTSAPVQPDTGSSDAPQLEDLTPEQLTAMVNTFFADMLELRTQNPDAPRPDLDLPPPPGPDFDPGNAYDSMDFEGWFDLVASAVIDELWAA